MSELINNRKKRQELLKGLILELHNGHDFDDVKRRFEEQFSNVSAKEISELEQALIKDGMPVENIQRLCDVHTAVFKGSIEEIHNNDADDAIPGHPVHTFRLENSIIAEKTNEIIRLLTKNNPDTLILKLKELTEIDKHYSRKENIIFPLLEKHNITGPPKVMWAIDDEVRQELKALINDLEKGGRIMDLGGPIGKTIGKINEMVYKEDNILISMTLETFSQDEWDEIQKSSEEIGYSFIEVENLWRPKHKSPEVQVQPDAEGNVKFDSGILTKEELQRILNTLPFDITFVDNNDKVKYFSEGTERIFPRPRTVIGRAVSNCHPPASVHIVEELVNNLRSGKKDHEDFWIKMGSKFVYIRYFAVRSDSGEYLGTLEVTQNIKNIVELEGEKRLVQN